jgi:hypothetical protein
LPEPVETIASTSTSTPLAEYPAARHLKDSLWVCSDGFGTLYVVDADRQHSRIKSSWQLYDEIHDSPMPCALHAATIIGNEACAVISASIPSSVDKTQNRFKVDIVQFDPYCASDVNTALTPVAKLAGPDLPAYVAFKDGRFIIGSSGKYRSVKETQEPETNGGSGTEQAYEPKPDEIVGIPRQGIESQPVSLSAPPPYSWNQTSDEVSVVFPLPTSVNVRDIKVVFRPNSVSMMVSGSNDSQHKLPIPQLDMVKLWDDIDAGTSTWTWEKTDGDKGQFGLLALHLEKKHEDTRWTHLLKQDDNPNLKKEFLDVDETLDRSELARITEAMEKFTQEVAAGSSGDNGGFNQRSSLIGDELDMDVDAPDVSNGKGLVFTWVEGLGSDSVQTCNGAEDEIVEFISSSLPTAANPPSSIIAKHDVDGLLFEPPADPSQPWKHLTTYPALSFVLASKRDVVHVYHHGTKLALGLETGSPVAMQRQAAQQSYSSLQASKMNAYVYCPPPPGSKAKTAQQKVVRLGEADAGAVLGAIAVERDDQLDIAILCERELIVMKNVL